ncbi:MAG: HAD hydrolase-like protein [Chitinivibrionia bacterium]|nr:HAD hydrolase-like protein [Chitinivibrionia bacterium]
MNTNKYTTIIWDWNGTIVDDSRLTFDIYCEECELYNLKKMDFDEYKKRFYFPVSKFYEEVGLPKEKYRQIADKFAELYRPKWNEIKVHQQVHEYLTKFKNAGISQFILSAYEQNELCDMVSFFDLREYFTEIAGVYDNLAKSKVQRGKELIESRKIDAKKTLMIGDTPHDFEVAAALGADALLLSWGTVSHEKLAQTCDEKIVFRNLKEAFEK